MTDTTITLTPSTAFTSGTQTVTASAALFTSDCVGQLLSLRLHASARGAATAYAAGVIFYAAYAGVNRLYRVTGGGTTASASMAGTTPNYDLNAPNQIGSGIIDGTCTLLYLGQGSACWGWGTITAVASSTSATVNVNGTGPFASTTATMNWRLGEFTAARGYPSCGTFWKQRLWLGGTLAKPHGIWAGIVGDFTTFSPVEPDDAVLDTDGIAETIDDDHLNQVLWMVPTSRGLVVGVSSGEFTVTPANAAAGLSPSNVDIVRQSDRPTATALPAFRVGVAVLFFDAGGLVLREMAYDIYTDSFPTPALSLLSDHITGTGIVDAAYQARPYGTLWMVRADGALVTLTYDRDQKVRAWSKHLLGGTDAQATSVCCVPSPDGTTDDVYVTVKRTVNGATLSSVEYIPAPFRADLSGADAAFFVDCGLAYSGTAATTFSGLDHLDGETVWILADGSVRQNQVVAGGAVTITGPAASTVAIGLPYTYRVTTLPPEAGAGATQGTAQNKPQRVQAVTLRLLESGGGAIGRAGGSFDNLFFRTVDDPIGTAVPLFTGDKRVPFPAGWDRLGQITVEQNSPLPFTILGVIKEMSLSG